MRRHPVRFRPANRGGETEEQVIAARHKRVGLTFGNVLQRTCVPEEGLKERTPLTFNITTNDNSESAEQAWGETVRFQ